VLATTTSMSAAWCLLSATDWYWLHRYHEHLFLGKVMVAMTWCIVFIVAVFVFALLLQHFGRGTFKRSFKGEFTAVALAVGLSWEHLFDVALEEVGENVEEGEHRRAWIAFFIMAMICIVCPAWTVYILPKHDTELTKLYGDAELHPWQAFFDTANDYEPEDSSGDEKESENSSKA